MSSKARAIRLPDDMWNELAEIASQLGSSVNGVVVSALTQYVKEASPEEAQRPRYRCAACDKEIKTDDPVIKFKDNLYCNLDHFTIALWERVYDTMTEMGYAQYFRMLAGRFDVTDVLRTESDAFQGPWLLGQRAEGLLHEYQWDRAHPQICKTCGGVFGTLSKGDKYVYSRYGSHHVGCLVPGNRIIVPMVQGMLSLWVSPMNTHLRQAGMDDKTVDFNGAVSTGLSSGRWDGQAVSYA
jgi:hypothetical protein